MQRLKEGHQRRRLWGIKIVSVGGHVPAALEHLTNQLIASETNSDGIKSRGPLSAGPSERVAIVALLLLKHQSALNLKRRSSAQKCRRDGSRSRCIHDRTPRCMIGHAGERAQRYSQ